jgi:hypothetical protein
MRRAASGIIDQGCTMRAPRPTGREFEFLATFLATSVTFVAGGTRTRIEQRRLRAGLATSSRTVRTRSGRRARVRLRLRAGTRYVAVRAMEAKQFARGPLRA